MTLTAIVAMTPHRIIGRGGDLPWHLPEDLQFFKKTTSGHPIVMGRKTYESIGRPLPKRTNIVLTRDRDWSADGVTVIHSPEDLGQLGLTNEEAFIIGGAEIYSAFLPLLNSIIVSHVHESHEGDTVFPEYESTFSKCELLEEHEDFTVLRHTRA